MVLQEYGHEARMHAQKSAIRKGVRRVKLLSGPSIVFTPPGEPADRRVG